MLYRQDQYLYMGSLHFCIQVCFWTYVHKSRRTEYYQFYTFTRFTSSSLLTYMI